ncbi:MAG: hypothetical protein IKP71_04430 [Candidatus Riflebacteria bacterium]|nr:hypothetical protein [Candidatus Riflebacteria bacterium]
MLMLNNRMNKLGFTVAEVVVAAAIFVVFSGAVFSLYRMGSRMYVSGSWKFMRQKEAERFFEVLKERVEQSSDIIKVNPAGDPNATNDSKKQIIRAETNFVTLKNNTCISIPKGQSAGSNIQLAEFATCKPDLTLIDKSKKGLVLFHSLMLVANKSTGLYDLHLRVQKDNNAANGINYFGSLSKPCIGTYGGLTITDFSGNNVENMYGLGPVPHTFILKDVASVTIGVSKGEVTGNGTDFKSEPSIFGITVQMRNPQHDKTILEMGYKAKVDGSVGLEVK